MTTKTTTPAAAEVYSGKLFATYANAARKMAKPAAALPDLRWVVVSQDGGFYPMAYGSVARENMMYLAENGIRTVG